MKVLKFSVGTMMTNCYFIVDEETKRCALVDPGDDAERLLEKLKEKGLTVEIILLTHAHFDHIMALPAIQSATNAPIALHKSEAELLSDNDKNCMRRFGRRDLAMPTPTRLLEEGDTVSVGNQIIRVLHTPGHTPGSVCYLAGSNLLTGDTLFFGSCGRTDLYGGDYQQMLSSLSRLCSLEENYRIFPGHGASTHLLYEKENNIYLQ